MKKFLVLLVLAAATALAIWLGIRGSAARMSSGTVTSLLPKETLALVHLPDLNRTRADWRETDLYKLWREPALQEFLQKPLAKVPNTETARQRLAELEALEIKDAFFAVVSWENKQSKLLGGFHFKGSAADAEKVLGNWRAHMQLNAAVQHETVTHESHQIEVVTNGSFRIATVYDGNWFLAANDVDALKTMLDRADHRLNDAPSTLAAEENFIAASKHMPMSYASRVYARVDRYFEKFSESLPPEAPTREQFSLLRKIRSISAATTFEKGKIRDVTFVAMPQLTDAGALTRESLNLAKSDAFLYFAGLLTLPKEMPSTAGAGPIGFPVAIQRLVASSAAKGITLDSLKSAFSMEFGIIGEWSENARLPSLFATLPVKDATKAREIVAQFIEATAADRPWAKSVKDGVEYYAQPSMNPMVPVTATIGLSNERLVIGHDPAGMEAVMKRSGAKSSELAGTEIFKSAERMVPPARYSFTYLDTGLFYTRLDAALRPMLIMAAAFMPAVAETVDLSKLPPPEVITRHLSPIVMSHNYVTDGYVSESVGPMSMYQAVLGIAATAGTSAGIYQNKFHLPGVTSATQSPSPTPEEESDDEE